MDFNTLWKAKKGDSKVFSLKNDSEINVLVIQENISKGQRIESFDIDIKTEEGWKNIVKGTTVGYKRIFRVDGFRTDKIRITINQTRNVANICNVAAYYAGDIEETNKEDNINDISRDKWSVISENPLVLDLGEIYKVNSFVYAPISNKKTIAYKYDLSVSLDGMKWVDIRKNGEFGNIINNPVPQIITLENPENVRFIRINATSVEGTNASIDLKEIGVKVNK